MAATSPRDGRGGGGGSVETLPSSAESAPSPAAGSAPQAASSDSEAVSEERERERNLGLLGLRDSDAAAPAFQMSTQILAPVLARRRTFGPNSGISRGKLSSWNKIWTDGRNFKGKTL